MSKKRVHFEDLFELSDDGLILKRNMIIGPTSYEIGDLFNDENYEFMSDPEAYFYIVNPLRVGDTLDSFMLLE